MSTTTEIVGTTLRTVHFDGGGKVTAVSYRKLTEAELIAIVGGGGGGGAWGSITGTLSSQTDLQTALNLKANLDDPTFTTGINLAANANAILGDAANLYLGTNSTVFVTNTTDFNYAGVSAAAHRTALGLGALATVTPGTGVATALAVNIGSAGAPVLFNGAGGTPSSLTGTNITGTAAGLTAGLATAGLGLKTATTTVAVDAATAPTSGQVLTATSSTTATWQTPSGGSAADPTASVGLTAVNGAAATFMRSDGAPALDVAISPVWTGAHTIKNDALASTTAVRLTLTNTTPAQVGVIQMTPSMDFVGSVWKTNATAGPEETRWRLNALPVQGASGACNLQFQYGQNGTTPANVLTLTNAGILTSATVVGSTNVLCGTTGIVNIRGSSNASGNGVLLSSLTMLGFASGTAGTTTQMHDALFTRAAAANIRQGASDSATPVAQTSSVQGVTTGTLNTAGADRTYSGSQSTGTGVGGSHVFTVTPAAAGSSTSQNSQVEAFRITGRGGIQVPTTVTAGGTTGNQTIDKTSGTVNIAAAGTTVTVTNRLCSANSIVMAVIRTNDTTAVLKNVVPGAGSFVINLNAACTAETSIGFMVFNP